MPNLILKIRIPFDHNGLHFQEGLYVTDQNMTEEIVDKYHENLVRINSAGGLPSNLVHLEWKPNLSFNEKENEDVTY